MKGAVAVVVAVYGARLRRHGEGSTRPLSHLRRECRPRNYGYALTRPACVLELAPENHEVAAQHSTFFLKLFPLGPPNPARYAVSSPTPPP